MPMSVKRFGQWLYFALVPIVLLAGTSVAVWLAVFGHADDQARPPALPYFNYQAPEKALLVQQPGLVLNSSQTQKDLFRIDTTAGNLEQQLELNDLALGMIIANDNKRLCLTNGVLFHEGDKGNGFTVDRIESHRVWYQIGSRKIFLRIGEKVTIDSEGNVQE